MRIPTVRLYHPRDREDVYDVAVRVGDAGADARDLYPDPGILPAVFTGPYVELEPDLAFVVDSGGRAVGYIVGTADTAEFVRRYREEWLPRVSDRYPAPQGPPESAAEQMALLLHRPESMLREEVAGYPAHLHINLLPEVQRAGYGNRLMKEFLAALRAKGVPHVHLGVASRNTKAISFYQRAGFYEIPTNDRKVARFFGRSTEPT